MKCSYSFLPPTVNWDTWKKTVPTCYEDKKRKTHAGKDTGDIRHYKLAEFLQRNGKAVMILSNS